MCSGAECHSERVLWRGKPNLSQMSGVQLCSPPCSPLALSNDKAEAIQWLKEGLGAAEGTRTPDPIITNDVLYQLSYSGLVAGY